MTEPASIRYKNPGAMWGGNAISKKWGEVGNVKLSDGMGQNNHIAVFPTYVQGICAQIDLWRSARYRNKRFDAAIAIWSGGNWVPSYIKFVKDRVPGMTEGTIINDAFLSSPMGIAFLKAQAWHEAGKQYPAPDTDWIEAQKRVFSDAKPDLPPTTAAAAVDGAWLQASLNTLGAAPILVVDGSVGAGTRAAVRTFQASHGLTVDGLVGPATIAAIKAALTPAAPVIPKPPEIKLPPPGQVRTDLAPTFWGRVKDLFK